LTVGYDTRRVAGSGGVELATDVWRMADGASPVLPGFVLIHGLASNARLYDGVAGQLVEAGHAVATLDLRGHGRSDKPDSGYDYDSMCSDVAAVLEELAVDPGPEYFSRPVVVGQSFGGNLVLELAARYPDGVSGVVCIDGGTIDLGSGFSSWEEAAAALTPPQIAGTMYADIELRFTAMHPDWPAAGIRGSLANFEVRADGTVAPWLTLDRHMKILRTMWESSPRAVFPRIKVPVLLLPAESPGVSTAWTESKHESVRQALSLLTKARVHWFSPADHDVHAQHPDQVASVLLEAAGDLFASS
jgi:pimeloyl-ACP methyl ester carboxylesterase